MDMRVRLIRKLSTEELMLLNCGVGENSWGSLGLQGDQTVHSKGNQSWIFIARTDAKAETPILWPPDVKSWFIWKDPDAGKDWRWQEKGWQRMRWLDGITDSMDMSLSIPGSWWWTGRPGVLQFMGFQRFRHDWVTGLNWYLCVEMKIYKNHSVN